MNRTEIESLVQRWAAAVASGRPDGLAPLIAEDARDVSGATPAQGRATFLARAAAVQSAFAGIEVRVDAVVIDGASVAWRWTLTGTENGRPVTLRGVNFQRLEAGVVVEHWTQVSRP